MWEQISYRGRGWGLGELWLHPQLVAELQPNGSGFCSPPRSQPTVPYGLPSHPQLPISAMVQMWPRLHLYTSDISPQISLLLEVLARAHHSWVLLVALLWPSPSLVYRPCVSPGWHPLGDPSPKRSSISSSGDDISSLTSDLETLGLAPDAHQLIDYRFLSLDWGCWYIFQQGWPLLLLCGCFFLRAYEAAISVSHIPLEGTSVGIPPLVSLFMRSARQIRDLYALSSSSLPSLLSMLHSDIEVILGVK